MPRATAPRRKKRDSTTTALDILNNVNNVNVGSPPYRPRQSHRAKIGHTQFTRSGSIFDVPSSDDDDRFSPSKRSLLLGPGTPRRSTRLKAKPGGEVAPSHRTRLTASVELGEEDLEGDSEGYREEGREEDTVGNWREDRDEESHREPEHGSEDESKNGLDENQDEEPDEEIAEPSDDDQEEIERGPEDVDVHEDHRVDEFPQAVLFSGGHDSPCSSNDSNQLSPFDIQKQSRASPSEKSWRSDEAGDESSSEPQNESESQYGTPRALSIEQADESRSGFDDSLSAQEQPRSSIAVVVNPAADIRSSMDREGSAAHSQASSERNPRSEDMTRSSPLRTESRSLNGDLEPSHAEPQSDGEDQGNIPVEEEPSAYIPSDDEGSLRDRLLGPRPSSYSESEEESPMPPSKRCRTSRHHRDSEAEGQRRRSVLASQKASSVNPRRNENDPLHRRQDSSDREQHVVAISDDESAFTDEEEPWLEQALKFGGQKANWDILVDEARTLKESTRTSMAEYFANFDLLTSELQESYSLIVDYLQAQRRPPRATVRDCDYLLDAITKEADSLLDDAYDHKDDKERQPSSIDLVDEFECRLVSGMVGVMFPCFEAYYQGDELFPKAYNHLHRVLNVFHRICGRIYGLVRLDYVSSKSRSYRLQRPLKKFIGALEENLFREGVPLPASKPAISIKYGKRWTEEEGSALLDGLQRYQGRNRYVQILEHFKKQLRGRTIRSVRNKARQLHDNLLSSTVDPDELQTEEGRERWQWLLSIRED
ncbi:hypothetical protein BDV23DRAFT_184928 [Aspergillus alliaceus]|uniref:Myb-like domain-containing protein n=1 Tax=Petromyces alliaceus TaxID=209559 RepID=A0A5N7C495_PETAA|nr:hypothetical protein BDV23DRAFT_184928 [Aspergillus alliaceus]